MLTQAAVTAWGQRCWQWLEQVGRGQVQRCELCWRYEPWPGCWRSGQRFCENTCGELSNRLLTESLYVQREGPGRRVRLPWDTLQWWQRLGAWWWCWQHWGDPDHRLGLAARGSRCRLAWQHERLWVRVLWADAWVLRLPRVVRRGVHWWRRRRARRSVAMADAVPNPAVGSVEDWPDRFTMELARWCEAWRVREFGVEPGLDPLAWWQAVVQALAWWVGDDMLDAVASEEVRRADLPLFVSHLHVVWHQTWMLALEARRDEDEDEDDEDEGEDDAC